MADQVINFGDLNPRAATDVIQLGTHSRDGTVIREAHDYVCTCISWEPFVGGSNSGLNFCKVSTLFFALKVNS